MLPNAIYSLIYGISSRAVLLIINFFAVRLLIPAEYGTFSYFIGIIASLATLSSFGAGIATNTTVARHLTSDPVFVKKVIYSSIILSSALALLLSAALIPLLKIPNEQTTNPTFHTYAILATIIWLISFNGITEGSLNGASEYKKLSINGIVTLSISAPISLIITWHYGLTGALVSIILYRLLIATLNTYAMRGIGILQLRMPLSVTIEKPVRDVFTSLSLPSVLGALMVAPVVALAMRMVATQENGLEELAYFSWVYQIYLVAVFVPGALGGYFLSRFSRQHGTPSEFLQILKYNVIFSSIVVALLFLLKPLLLEMAGAAYTREANSIFNILIPTVILYSANTTFSSYWPSQGKAWFGFMINTIWASIILIATWLYVESLGAEALAFAFMISYITLFALQTAFAWHLSAKKP